MCQLTLSNIPGYNRIFLMNQIYINTSEVAKNRDGWGIFSKNSGVFRCEKQPHLITDVGKYINKLDEEFPCMLHVRHATFTNSVKYLSIENTHPFITEDFIVAHNGALEFKDSKIDISKLYPNCIDSKIFTLRLQENYINRSVAEAIKITLNEFYGKFAFIIYSRKESLFYIVKGTTATLYTYNVFDLDKKYLGYVVNTNKDDLFKGILYTSNFIQVNGGRPLIVDLKLIEELTVNSIFTATEAINKIDTVEESFKPRPPIYTNANNGYDSSWVNNVRNNIDRQLPLITPSKIIASDEKELLDFMTEFEISIYYLDEIFYTYLGKGLLSCTAEDIHTFIDYILPDIKLCHKNIIKCWSKLLNTYSCNEFNIHTVYGIEFPYMVEKDIRKIRNAIKDIKELSGDNGEFSLPLPNEITNL